MGLLFCYCRGLGDKSLGSTELGRVKIYIYFELAAQDREYKDRKGTRAKSVTDN